MSKYPRVVIVGRTNVGKSTLFNRLSTSVKSLTLDFEGVTRDFLSDEVCWQNVCFELIDSGGIQVKPLADPLEEQVRKVALSLIEDADIILFVCDGKAGVVQEDIRLARYIHKLGKKVFLVINKIDSKEAQEKSYEFQQLGFKESFGISALHGHGIAELLDAIVNELKDKKVEPKEEERKCTIVLLGKPNVGKSSLMNLLLDRERTIVSDIPGTTREAITEPIRFYKETIQLTDTPGIRRQRSIDEPLERLMVKTAFRAVENADIVLMMIDGSQGKISNQELKLLFYVFEQKKAVILLVNKDDIADEVDRVDLEIDLDYYQHFFKKIPQLFISCKTGKNIGKILPLINEVWQRYTQKFNDNNLTEVLREALKRRPLFHKTERLQLYKAKQVKTAPLTIVLYVNMPEWFGESQLAFFENVMRKNYDLLGVPIKFILRKG